MKKLTYLFLLFLLIGAMVSRGQSCDPNFDPGCEDVDNEVPLDGGVVFLIGASVLFVAYKHSGKFIYKRG